MAKFVDRVSYIYTLNHPVTNEIRYVGWTHNSVERRLYDHCRDREWNAHKVNWIKTLLPLKPTINIIETIPPMKNWEEREQYWIQFYKNEGKKLINKTIGGEGTTGYKHTDKYKQALSERQKGRKLPKEVYDKIADRLRGRTRPQHVIDAIRAANTGERSHCFGKPAHNRGVPSSEESKRKLSESRKGIVISAEHRIKLSEALKGKPKSEEHNKKVGDALRGRKQSDQTIATLTEVRRANHMKRVVEQGYSIANKRNSSGHPGVSWNKRAQKWEVYVCIGGKTHRIGLFKDIDEGVLEKNKFLATIKIHTT